MSLLTDFEIENFRCFDTFKMHNIKRINLIGGMNNAGKTALLEALFLSDGIDGDNLKQIYQEIRAEKLPNNKQSNDADWLPLFYKGRIDQFIKLKSKYTSLRTKDIYARTCILPDVRDFANSKTTAQDLLTELVTYPAGSFLYAGTYINDETTSFLGFKQVNMPESKDERSLEHMNLFSPNDWYLLGGNRSVIFIADANTLKNENLIKAYDELKRKGHGHKLLSAFQLIEPTIESIEVLNLQHPTIHLTRKGEHIPLALSYFGDAMVKIAAYTMALIKQSGSIFLFDEVENGIHYTNQPKFWAWLFDLATEFDIQIFATTHSREMIEAYAQTAIEKDMVKEAVYYELYRDASTAQVKNHRITVDTIPFKLERNKPIRGERE